MHRINLKGPWEYRPVNGPPDTSDDDLPGPGTVKFPAAWQDFLGNFRGRVEFLRPFNRPTNLDAHERVDLVLDGIGGSAVICLNQQSVGQIADTEGTGRFDITGLLQLHNLLKIQVEWSSKTGEPGGLWAPVALEIIPI